MLPRNYLVFPFFKIDLYKFMFMKKLLFCAAFICTILSANAQYYELNFLSNPGNPGGINTDPDYNGVLPPAGSTTLVGDDKNVPKFSAVQTLPFAFQFNGGPVTKYRVSSAGFLTFSTTSMLNTSTPSALPTSTLPDSSICVWGLCTAGGNGGTYPGMVYTKVYGTAPHRQFWAVWYYATNPADTSSEAMWGIVLEETTNNIYIVDEMSVYAWPNVLHYTTINLTLGIQVTNSLAYQVAGSPNVNSLEHSNIYGDNTINDYYEFLPGIQNPYDAVVKSTNINNADNFGVGNTYPISALITNLGSSSLSSLTLNWQVTGGPVNSNATTVSIAHPNPIDTGTAYSIINWVPAATGTYTMKIWATLLNGSHANLDPIDTLTINNLHVLDTVVPKMVMFEEFMQASCGPCLYSCSNFDATIRSTKNICNYVRYHTNFPGVDYMNSVTQSLVVAPKVNFYGVFGVPIGQLDGGPAETLPNTVTPLQVRNEAALGGLLSITITSCTYTAFTNTFNVQAKIHSYVNLPATVVQAVLTVDTMKYSFDQSTEDPLGAFQPPIANGSVPDSLYPYVVNFPNVAEALLPDSNGTTLNPFTAGHTQTINVSWVKNHSWGLSPNIHPYDSTGCHITVFVQTVCPYPYYTSSYIYQSASAPVVGDETGIKEIEENGLAISMYPNPAKGIVGISYYLNNAQNVNLELFNSLGQKVYGANQGITSAGQHSLVLNVQQFEPAVYFIRITTDNATTVKKLVIQR
jgi:hypothetical protein